jgi:probable DNA metabolism protein
MLVYTFDRTLDGLLTAVFDAFALHQQPELLVGKGGVLPMFTEKVHQVVTADDKARRVWTGLEKLLSKEAVRVIAVSYLSEDAALDTPLFHYICKAFREKRDISTNFTDQNVLFVRNTCRRVMHEQLRMKQFMRFQKAKDGTYLGVVSPDHNVLPLIIDHFQDRFGDQPWLIYDTKRSYGYYHDTKTVIRVTFENDEKLPFDRENGKLNDALLSENDKLFQELWRTYFKAICIKERINPRKQLSDMPRRYWRYMTEKQ